LKKQLFPVILNFHSALFLFGFNYICQKLENMKYALLFIVGIILLSCGVKIPYTDEIRDEFSLNNGNLDKVQFYTSATIILERVTSETNERIIIPVNTKCVWQSTDKSGNLIIRFDESSESTLTFKSTSNRGKMYLYLKDFNSNGKYAVVYYNNLKYYCTSSSGNAYLMVVIKKI